MSGDPELPTGAGNGTLEWLVQRAFVKIGCCPHLFDVVELADLGTEDMNDDVAGVDQHPVAAIQTFDAGIAEALVLKIGHDMVGNRQDMAARATGDDDHVVSKRGLSSNVDGDDILGLGVLEACEDGLQGAGSGIGATFRALWDNDRRSSLGVYCCQCSSFLE